MVTFESTVKVIVTVMDEFALWLWVKVVDTFVSKIIGYVKKAGGPMIQASSDPCI